MRVDTAVQGTVVVATNCKCYEALPRSLHSTLSTFSKNIFHNFPILYSHSQQFFVILIAVLVG
jgi:hypothetical protein